MSKTALITGASSGFGLRFAEIFAQDGYNLVIVARSTDRLNAIKKQLEGHCGVEVTVITKDLSCPSAAREIFDYTQSRGIDIDVLVNNAGFGILGDFAPSQLEKQQQLINLNVLTLVSLTHLYLPYMLSQRHGRILNVASIAAFAPGPGMATYYASKAFVLNFSDALATELKGSGVTVTALCPGPVNTGFADRAGFRHNAFFNGKNDGKSYKVSRYGYEMMKKGKSVAVPGAVCKAGVIAARLAPRQLTKNIIYRVQTSRLIK